MYVQHDNDLRSRAFTERGRLDVGVETAKKLASLHQTHMLLHSVCRHERIPSIFAVVTMIAQFKATRAHHCSGRPTARRRLSSCAAKWLHAVCRCTSQPSHGSDEEENPPPTESPSSQMFQSLSAVARYGPCIFGMVMFVRVCPWGLGISGYRWPHRLQGRPGGRGTNMLLAGDGSDDTWRKLDKQVCRRGCLR
jgi:hypothetical protein